MKRAILMTAMICLTALMGCAEVPDEVLQDMSGYRDEERVEHEEQKFKYIKTAELSEDVEKTLKKDYKQFKISDKIRFVQPEELHIMHFEAHNDIDDFYGIMGMFFDNETLQSLNVEKDDEGYQCVYDEDKRIYANVCRDGFVAALRPEGFDMSYSEDGDLVKIYHADRDDDLSDTYPLADRECSVKEAVDFVNKFLDENTVDFFLNLTMRLKR